MGNVPAMEQRVWFVCLHRTVNGETDCAAGSDIIYFRVFLADFVGVNTTAAANLLLGKHSAIYSDRYVRLFKFGST